MSSEFSSNNYIPGTIYSKTVYVLVYPVYYA